MRNLDVLLIHPPVISKEQEMAGDFSLFHFEYIGYGMLHIAAFLKREGYNVGVWNIPLLFKKGHTTNEIITKLKKFDPIVIGIELNWFLYGNGALEWAKLLKDEFPNSKIVIGGTHASFSIRLLNNQQTSQMNKKLENIIDLLCFGEAEKTFLTIIQLLETEKEVKKVRGTAVIKNGTLCDNGPPEIFENIDKIPPYSLKGIYPKMDFSSYLGLINTTRGSCIHACKYCIGNCNSKLTVRTKLAFHSPQWIMDQIQCLVGDVKAIGISDISYANPKKVLEYLKRVQECPEILKEFDYFSYTTLPGVFDKEIFEHLSKSGITNLNIGIETGSDKILKMLKRPYTSQEALDTVKSCVEHGMMPLTYWMLGFPFENQQDLEKTKQLLNQTIDLGAIPYTIELLQIYPLTELYENAAKYEIQLKIHTLEEFNNFGSNCFDLRTQYSEDDFVTHETSIFNAQKLVQILLDFKQFLKEKSKYIIKIQKKLFLKYQNLPPTLKYIQFEQIVKSIFYLAANFSYDYRIMNRLQERSKKRLI